MADAATSDDDDPYVKLGRAITSGKAPAASSAANDDDPYVAAGRKITAPLLANPPSEADTPAAAAPVLVGNVAPTGIPSIDNLLSGGIQGVKDVVATGEKLAKWVDDRVPLLSALDRSWGNDPGALVNRLNIDRAAYENSDAGNSLAGGIGRFGGGLVASAPLLGPVGAGAGAITRGAASLLPEAGPVANLLARPIAGPVLNFAGRGVSRGIQGAAGGAAYGAATSGGSDQPVADNVKENALAGAVAGPLLGAVGEGAGWAGRGVKDYYRDLSGKTAAQDVEDTVAAARERAAAQTPATPTAGDTAPGAPAPGPQAGGAQASTAADTGGVNTLTPDEVAAQRLRNFDLRMQQGARSGEDWTEYVQGSKPTLAEGLGDAHLAGVQRNVLAGDQRIENWDDSNLAARQEHIGKLSGDSVSVDNLNRARDAQGKEDLKSAWAGKGEADAQPVLDHINETLATEDGKLKPVRAALNEVKDALHNSNGDLETDPQLLYGARRQITYMLSKTGRSQNPSYGDEDVMRNLIQTRDVLDQKILDAAPRFQTFLDNFRAASPEIDKQEFLQKFHLTDAGAMTLPKVNQMMNSVRSGLNATGVHPAKSIDDGTIDQLFNLRADLLRQSNRKLAAPLGSPTAYNQGLGAELGINAAHTGVRSMISKVPLAGTAADALAQRSANRNIQITRDGYIKNLLAPHAMTPPEPAPNLLQP